MHINQSYAPVSKNSLCPSRATRMGVGLDMRVHFYTWGLGILLIFLSFAPSRLAGQITLPPAPPRYFNDFANIVSGETAQRLNQRLADFERQTSNQIVVVVYPKLPEGVALDDYAQQVFRAWKVGQKERDNGAILFVFVNDRKLRIQTGRGLEGALPDIICKRIISDEVAPRFRTGDYDGGLTAAVDSMISATKGEYQGNGRTVADNRRVKTSSGGGFSLFLMLALFFILISFFGRAARRRGIYSNRRRGSGGIWWFGGGGGGNGGGGFGGGGDGGGFSGGGGDSGGGGASGDW
ncbi:MAG: TPM domain-containing protein [Verrucomicrobia bacterium]|nr:TPM domain-containing protein [Verrucomicrobiota bacterium]